MVKLKRNICVKVSELQASQEQLLSNQEEQAEHYKAQLALSQQRNQQLTQELGQSRGQLTALQQDMIAGKDIIQAANETIVIKV